MTRALLVLTCAIALAAAEAGDTVAGDADVSDAVRRFEQALAESQDQDARAAAEAFEKAAADQATPGSDGERAQVAKGIHPAADDLTTIDGVSDALATVLMEAARDDMATQVLQARFLPKTELHVEDPSDLASTGSDGVVWVFWAQDAPQCDLLAGQVNRLRAARRGLRVVDVHMMPLTRWLASIREMSGIRELLERNDPTMSDDIEAKQKLRIRDDAVAKWNGFTAMAKYNRDGGYAIVEDMTAAKFYQVARLPALRFVSRNGVQHRRDGLSEGEDLETWVGRCEAWERDHLDEVLRHAR